MEGSPDKVSDGDALALLHSDSEGDDDSVTSGDADACGEPEKSTTESSVTEPLVGLLSSPVAAPPQPASLLDDGCVPAAHATYVPTLEQKLAPPPPPAPADPASSNPPPPPPKYPPPPPPPPPTPLKVPAPPLACHPPLAPPSPPLTGTPPDASAPSPPSPGLEYVAPPVAATPDVEPLPPKPGPLAEPPAPPSAAPAAMPLEAVSDTAPAAPPFAPGALPAPPPPPATTSNWYCPVTIAVAPPPPPAIAPGNGAARPMDTAKNEPVNPAGRSHTVAVMFAPAPPAETGVTPPPQPPPAPTTESVTTQLSEGGHAYEVQSSRGEPAGGRTTGRGNAGKAVYVAASEESGDGLAERVAPAVNTVGVGETLVEKDALAVTTVRDAHGDARAVITVRVTDGLREGEEQSVADTDTVGQWEGEGDAVRDTLCKTERVVATDCEANHVLVTEGVTE